MVIGGKQFGGRTGKHFGVVRNICESLGEILIWDKCIVITKRASRYYEKGARWTSLLCHEHKITKKAREITRTTWSDCEETIYLLYTMHIASTNKHLVITRSHLAIIRKAYCLRENHIAVIKKTKHSYFKIIYCYCNKQRIQLLQKSILLLRKKNVSLL